MPGYGAPIGTTPSADSAGERSGSQRYSVQAIVSSVGP